MLLQKSGVGGRRRRRLPAEVNSIALSFVSMTLEYHLLSYLDNSGIIRQPRLIYLN